MSHNKVFFKYQMVSKKDSARKRKKNENQASYNSLNCSFPRKNPPTEDGMEFSSTCWLVNKFDGKGGCPACRNYQKK